MQRTPFACKDSAATRKTLPTRGSYREATFYVSCQGVSALRNKTRCEPTRCPHVFPRLKGALPNEPKWKTRRIVPRSTPRAQQKRQKHAMAARLQVEAAKARQLCERHTKQVNYGVEPAWAMRGRGRVIGELPQLRELKLP